MNEKEKEYYEKFKRDTISEEEILEAEGKAKHLGDKKNDFLLLLDMISEVMRGHFKIPAWAVATIIGAIIYVISPIDAVPDFIPIAGWLDDGSVIAAVIGALGAIIREYDKYKEDRGY